MEPGLGRRFRLYRRQIRDLYLQETKVGPKIVASVGWHQMRWLHKIGRSC